MGNKRIEVRNLVSMKIIAVIEYKNTSNEVMKITKDKAHELLIVTFSSKKKVVRNIIYKVNNKYYYKK